MIRKLFTTGLVSLFALLTIVQPVSAQTQQPDDVMTEAHIQHIKQNCGSAKRTIQQLHTNDGPLRVNRGQVYASISSRLMTPLNSRLIVNKLDASSLVKTSAQYDSALSSFIEKYIKYDNQMTAVLAIDCVKQPVKFYDAVGEARSMRGEVHAEVKKLHSLINEYQNSFDVFRTQFSEGKAKGQES